MEPTVHEGDVYILNRAGMLLDGPHIGEIVVLHPPKGRICGGRAVVGPVLRPGTRTNAQEWWYKRDAVPPAKACVVAVPKEDTGQEYIKRVVAGPGDEIYISEGHVYRKAAGASTFVREEDSYIEPCDSAVNACDLLGPIRIPRGHWFVMGDHRGASSDSRFWGSVPTSWIIGGVIARIWPPDRIELF